MSWEIGDRLVHKTSGQRGIVEDLNQQAECVLVYWGVMNSQRYTTWVPDEECQWEPPPKGAA